MAAKNMKKLTRQIKRKQVLAKQQYPSWQWMFHEVPTRLLFVGNGGIKTGVSHRLILALLSEEPRHVYMPFECDFAILEFSDSRQCESEFISLNGCCVQEAAEKRGARHLVTPLLTSPPLHLFLSYLATLPSPAIVEQDLIRGCSSSECYPPGCHLLCDFLNKDEEAKLIDFFGLEQLDSVSTFQKTPEFVGKCPPVPSADLKLRSVKHYGYEFLYGSNTVDPSSPLSTGIPSICQPLLQRLMKTGLINYLPDQLTVNVYRPGAGIPPHVDTHSAFKDGIVSLSLGSHAVMQFTHLQTERKVSVFLPQRSLLVMTGEVRYSWSHGIPARKSDPVYPSMPGYSSSHSESSTIPHYSDIIARGTRVSLTFRKIHCAPCSCNYPQYCDLSSSLQAVQPNS